MDPLQRNYTQPYYTPEPPLNHNHRQRGNDNIFLMALRVIKDMGVWIARTAREVYYFFAKKSPVDQSTTEKTSKIGKSIKPRKFTVDAPEEVAVQEAVKKYTSTTYRNKMDKSEDVLTAFNYTVLDSLGAGVGYQLGQLTQSVALGGLKKKVGDQYDMGMPSLHMLIRYQEALEDFKKVERSNLSAIEIQEIDKFLGQLKFAIEVPVGLNYRTELDMGAYLSNKTITKISNLPIGESIMLSGGYQGHALMYKITRKEDANYSFTIVNTGEGSETTSSLFSKRGMKVRDVKYDDISLDRFQDTLFQGLFEIRDNGKSVDEVYKLLDTQFKKSKKTVGRKHKPQQKGSCAAKCITATAHEMLSPALFWRFKVWDTKNMIEHLDRIKSIKLTEDEEKTADNMLKKAKKILRKREHKAEEAQKKQTATVGKQEEVVSPKKIIASRPEEKLVQTAKNQFRRKNEAKEVESQSKQNLVLEKKEEVVSPKKITMAPEEILIQNARTKFQERYDFYMGNAENKLRSTIFTVLDSLGSTGLSKVKGSTKDFQKWLKIGMPQGMMLSRYYQSLKLYQSEHSRPNSKSDEKLTVEENQKINDLLKQLDQSIEIYSILTDKGARDKMIPYLSKKLENQVKEMKPGAIILIPGSTKSHGIMYKLTKEKDQEYSLTVINTGEGSIETIAPKFEQLPDTRKLLVTDIKYSKIKSKNLDSKFFSALLENYQKESSTKDIIEFFFDKKFTTENKTVEGRKHKPQNLGSCAHKSVTSAAQEMLPPRVYRHFKYWDAVGQKNEIQWMNSKELNSKELNWSDTLLNSLVSAADSVIMKRQEKIEDSRKISNKREVK